MAAPVGTPPNSRSDPEGSVGGAGPEGSGRAGVPGMGGVWAVTELPITTHKMAADKIVNLVLTWCPFLA